MLDFDVELPRLPRALPKRIPPGSHVLSHADLRSIARHFAGKDHARLGEEIIGHILPGMFDAPSGRHIPAEVLRHLGEGDHHAGREVLRRFLANIRQSGKPKPYARGGAVGKVSKESVNYRQAEDNEFCARCTMFRQPASCTAVEGRIHRVDLCDLYRQKAAA